MKLFFVCLFLLSACVNQPDLALVQGPSVKKQRQKIAVLQKKMELAENAKKKAEGEVKKIVAEMDLAKLVLIQKQLAEYEKRDLKPHNQFLEEREALYRIIESGPSPFAFEAQVELDRILRLITENSLQF